MKRFLPHIGLALILFGILAAIAIAAGRHSDNVPPNPFADYQSYMPGSSIQAVTTETRCIVLSSMEYVYLNYITCHDVGLFKYIFASGTEDYQINYVSFYPAQEIKAGWLWLWFDHCKETRLGKSARRIICDRGVEAAIRIVHRWNPNSKNAPVIYVRFKRVSS